MSLLSLLPSMATMMEPANIVGAIALSSSCIWPLLRDRKAILAVQSAGSMLFALHYFLLGATTGAVMCMMSVIQGISVILLTSRRAKIGVVGVTVGISLGVTAMTWVGLPSLMSQCGQIMGAMGRLQNHTQRLRYFFLAATLCWTTHNLMVGSVFGLAADTLALTGLLLGLWRNRRPASARPRASTSVAPATA